VIELPNTAMFEDRRDFVEREVIPVATEWNTE